MIAYFFRFPPSELWAMEADGWEVSFWLEQAERIAKRQRHA